MNIKISVAIFILLSFFNIGAISNNSILAENSFSSIEKNARKISEFEENGVKLQYKTQDNMETENVRIIGYLIQNVSGDYKEIQKDQFEIVNKDLDINIKSWYEDRYTYVEVTIINKNAEYTTKYLKNILEKLENKESEDVQYFLYYEGKGVTANNNDFMYKFINQNHIENAQSLEINNGYTGTGYLDNGNKVNFALSKYNTGSHIIIGTPIIFATY
ncbi:hypothetical protein [Clostridium sp.]|uniref:hypothetical protein n=1 Tax=Clostridium sp. TaxID=1506 RepID=UPI0028449069|nr:hypothetical protein [Clostridium sp.]MDR3595487.1 hypothetical protein [Clostridium sp.]